jgi:hypothetical protein
MRTPHFMRLAQIDEKRFISACRHGLVHLTWERATVRFSRDEFRRLVALLNRATSAGPPATFHDGDFRVTSRLDAESELSAGSWIIQLSPDEWHEFTGAAREALHRLDEILASGMWNGEPEDTQSHAFEGIRRVPFSKN